MQRLPSASRDAKNLIYFETKSFDLENASTKKRETLFFIFIMKISSFEKVYRDGIKNKLSRRLSAVSSDDDQPFMIERRKSAAAFMSPKGSFPHSRSIVRNPLKPISSSAAR